MSEAFLGVRKSVTGKIWQARHFDERQASALAQRYTLPDLIARTLSARGIDLNSAAEFLDPRLRDLMPDPSIFRDMDAAVERTLKAIRKQEKIAVYGDYDVDGATSAASLIRFFRMLGISIRLYVPDRFQEGYGPNANAMRQLSSEGINLVLCVDCGTTAYEPLKAAKDSGLDVIILDHHTSEPELPPCVAIINPNRLDENGDFGYLAAVGVTYLFIVAVNRALRAANWYSVDRQEPDLLGLLDLVALGTICDVVKLTGLNRAYVTQGIRVMRQEKNLGISALSRVAGQKSPSDTYAAGFILGPRVNAGGRVARSDLGAKLLSTDDPAIATQLAEQLHEYNFQRRDIEAQILAEAEVLSPIEDSHLIFVASENWHQGVIGIVASRLKDKFQHPALVIALEGGIGKGSGRSVPGIDLGSHIIAARQAGLLLNGGGHKMAAGFTVSRENLDALRIFLSERIAKQIDLEPIKPTLMLDGLLAATSLKPEFVKQIASLGPFGTGNSEPRFALADCRILRADVVGEKHVSIIALHAGERVRGIAFRAMENALSSVLLNQARLNVHLAGHLRLDEWQGTERVQFQISDVALAG